MFILLRGRNAELESQPRVRLVCSLVLFFFNIGCETRLLETLFPPPGSLTPCRYIARGLKMHQHTHLEHNQLWARTKPTSSSSPSVRFVNY